MKNTENIAKMMFISSFIFAIFIYGMAVGRYELFPFKHIIYVKDSFLQVYREANMLTKTKPTKHIFDSRHEGSGVVTFDKNAVDPSLTLISSFFDAGLEVRLISLDGKVVNRWPINILEIWENFNHIQPPINRPSTDWNSVFNGTMLLPDGSLVFNMFGLIKLDRCGNVKWKVPKMTHHSLEPAANGGFWVGGKNYIDSDSKHPPIKPPYEEDTLLKISSSGAIVSEISILDVLWKNNLVSVLFSNNREFSPNSELDVIHLNDVDELTPELSAAFPQFNAGDLLVSIRQPNMVLVIDPKTERIKWYQVGPWIQQHDADFQADGTITIFDNAYDGKKGQVFGGSKIISIDPSTGKTKTLYGGQDDEFIYTSVQGDQQVLKNGNILIAEANAGRIIEVDSNKHVVWEYINRYSDNEVLRLSDATRYSLDFFTVNNWSCNEKGL